MYLTKSYTTTQLMLTPYRCTPSQVVNNLHSWESGHFPVKQFVTQGKMTFTQAYQMSFIISKHFAWTFSRISHHTTLLLNWKQAAQPQFICATRRFNMSRSVHYIKMLACCTPFAAFTYLKLGLHVWTASKPRYTTNHAYCTIFQIGVCNSCV